MREFESVGQYHDHWAYVLLSAPDEFTSFDGSPVDQKEALQREFEILISGFHFADRKIRDARRSRIAKELLRMSLEAYLSGDAYRGAHIFQECEGMIWKSHEQKIKFAVEAEKRVYGTLELYKDTYVSPYPYEGSSDDLAHDQRRLFEHAYGHLREVLCRRETIPLFCVWIQEAHGVIGTLPSRSWKKAYLRLRELATHATISACAKLEMPFGATLGCATITVEERGRPQIQAVTLVKEYQCEPPRFFLYDPTVFEADGPAPPR